MESRVCPECGAVNTPDRDICFKCEELLVEITPAKHSGGMGTVLNIVFFVVIGLFLYSMMIPSYGGGSRIHSRQRACVANMKMLENALEMYDMDTPPPAAQTTVVCKYGTPELVSKYPLEKGGYIQRPPKCPESRKYNSYRVSRDVANGYALYVNCEVHGTISRPRKP